MAQHSHADNNVTHKFGVFGGNGRRSPAAHEMMGIRGMKDEFCRPMMLIVKAKKIIAG